MTAYWPILFFLFIYLFILYWLFLIGIEEYKIRGDGSILIDPTTLDYVDGQFLYMDGSEIHRHEMDGSQGHVVSTWLKWPPRNPKWKQLASND